MVPSDIPRAISKEELVKATENDEELQRLITCLRERKIDHRDLGMKAYSNLFEELAQADGVVLRSERIVVPRELIATVVKVDQDGHQGIVRTKQPLPTFGFPELIRWSKSTLGNA